MIQIAGIAAVCLLLTVLLVVLVEAMFLYSYTRSYYNGVQQTMMRRFSSISAYW